MATTLTQWEPMRELSEMRSRVDQMFHDMTSSTGLITRTIPVDFIREDGQVKIYCDLPGMNVDDIDIEVEDNQLTISGEREQEKTKEGANFIYRECSSGSFMRRLTLPQGANTDKIEAHITNGVLEVDIPVPEGGKKEKIEISSGDQ